MILLSSSTGESIFQLVVVLVIFVVVLILTYYATRWIAGYQKSHTFNKNLEVIETMKITTNKYVQIIKVGENRFFLIGIGKDEITTIGELSADDIVLTEQDFTASPMGGDAFAELLGKFKDRNKERDDNE